MDRDKGHALCDLCQTPLLGPLYEPPDTTRGLKVHVCENCGLVQSLPRRGSGASGRGSARPSAGADWGNIRYGKAFSTQKALALMSRALDLKALKNCLDIGANRGSFIEAFSRLNPTARFTAIEPDDRVIAPYSDTENVKVICSRMEDAVLRDSSFDMAYSCHTIEHVESPVRMLRETVRVLAPGGAMYIEAPKVDIIGRQDIIEEFFIDKHLYHFSERTLSRAIEAAGFEIIARGGPHDMENISFVARKRGPSVRAVKVLPDPEEAEGSKALVSGYSMRMEKNRGTMKAVGSFINSMEKKSVVVWGGGRLFDCLVRYGGLDPDVVAAVVDRHLSGLVEGSHGFRLVHPDMLDAGGKKTVVIMSRAYADEIREEARARFGMDARIYEFSSLMAEAGANG